jgi:flagella basal body P-ring formation protein FlgA
MRQLAAVTLAMCVAFFAQASTQSQKIVDQIQAFYLNATQNTLIKELSIQVKNSSALEHLPDCSQPVAIEDLSMKRNGKIAGRHTVKVSCNQPQWKTFLSVTISGKVPAIYSAKGILKSAVIKEGDIEARWIPAERAPDQRLISPKTVIGMRAKRNIRPNKLLTVKDLSPPYWVFKKNEVTLVTQFNGLTVKAPGIALKNGTEGQQVPVKNKHSGKVVKGIVIAPNTVKVP